MQQALRLWIGVLTEGAVGRLWTGNLRPRLAAHSGVSSLNFGPHL